MDSITQFTLGAVIGQIVAGRQYSIKAGLIGGLIGTIPDLDVFVGPLLYSDDILQSELFHRSVTHSFFYQAIGSFLFAGLFRRILPKLSYRKWWLIVIAGFVTHTIIDVGTSYGVWALLPFSSQAISTHNISIVDPIYTLPMLFGLILSWIGIRKKRGRRALWIGTTVAMTYYLLTFGIKYHVRHQIADHVPIDAPTRQRETPELANTLVRKVVTEDKQHYHLTRYHIFLDDPASLTRYTFPKNHHLLIGSDPSITTITHRRPKYLVRRRDDGMMTIQSVAMGPLGAEYGALYDTWLFGRSRDSTTQTLSRDGGDGRQAGDSISYSRKRLFHSQSELLHMIEEDF